MDGVREADGVSDEVALALGPGGAEVADTPGDGVALDDLVACAVDDGVPVA